MSSYYEKLLATGEVKCIDEEVPFEIPQGWEWCRMGSIGDWGAGATPAKSNPDYYGGSILWLRTGELNNGIVYDSEIKITKKALQECSLRMNRIGDVLIAMYGATIGKVAIVGKELTTNQACCACTPFGIYNYFLFFFLMGSQIDFIKKGEGGAQPNISREKLVSHLMPIPPLTEQYRIVEKIQYLLPLVEKYSDSQILQDKLNAEIKDKLRKSILQEAIQGKLVPQIAEEGSAQELLERIKEEKRKLVKEGKLRKSALNDSAIFRGDDNKYYTIDKKEKICIDDEMPFDIPGTWQWCRLGTLFSHCTGKALNASNLKGSLMTYITTSNLYWDRFELDNLKQMHFTDEEIEKCTATFGDLLVCEGGDIGRAAIWNYQYDIRIQNHIHKLRAYKQLCTKFFFWVFYFYKATGRIGGKGIGIQGLSSKALDNILIPLPPLKEQQRIVAQIEKLFEQLH